MNVLTVQHLTYCTADGTVLLRDVALQVATGSIVTVVGPSGSGKSTLLRTLNRLIEPPPNTVLLRGVDITTLPVITLRRKVGMVFQTATLLDGTVATNLRYGPALHGRVLADSELERLLQQVGLPADMLTRPVTALSGGQAQRVALARTLANDPAVLLLDEPTSALDPAATLIIEELVNDMRQRLKLSVVWVTHNVDQAQRVGDTTLLLVDGAVADWGPTADLLAGDSHQSLIQRFARGEQISKTGESDHANLK